MPWFGDWISIIYSDEAINCLKYGQTIIMQSDGLLIRQGEPLKKCEWYALVLVQAWNRATEGHGSAREMRKHRGTVRKKKYHPLDIWIHYLRQTRKKELRWKIKQAASSFLLGADRAGNQVLSLVKLTLLCGQLTTVQKIQSWSGERVKRTQNHLQPF